MAVTIAQDNFSSRTVSGSFGTGSDGQAWGTPFSNVRAVVGVASGEGSVYCTTSSSYASYEVLYGAYTARLRDPNESIRFQLNDIANGPELHLYARYLDSNNWYRVKITPSTLSFEKNVAGVVTSTIVASLAISAGVFYRCRFTLNNTALTCSVWSAGGSEPGTPTWTGTDSALGQPGQWGLGLIATGTTLPTGVFVDSLLVQTMNAPTTFYVAPTGSDSAGTGAAGSPFATPQFAMNSAVPGTTIIVNDGIYTAPGGASHTNYVSGLASSRIAIQSATVGGARLRTTGVFACAVNFGSYVDFSGFDLATDSVGRIGWLSYGAFSRIFASVAHDIAGVGNYPDGGGGFVTSPTFGGTHNSILGCSAYNISNSTNDTHAAMQGIYIACPGDTVSNCLVWNVTGFAIQSYHSGTAVTISNNEVWAYGQGGIVTGIDETVGGMLLDNCVVTNNIVRSASGNTGPLGTVYAIRESTPSGGSTVGLNNTYANNCIWQYGGSASFLYHATMTGTLVADPAQINFRLDGAGDYHLSLTSLCIGRGTSNGLPALDFDGLTRLTNDIGPYRAPFVLPSSPTSGGRLLIIGGRDRTQGADLSNFKGDEGITDKTPVIDMTVWDRGCINPVDVAQEVLLLDATASNQTVNLLLNPNLQTPIGGSLVFQPAPVGNAAGNWTIPPSNVTLSVGSVALSVFNFTASDWYISQWTQPNGLLAWNVAPGQTYCLSAYIAVTTPMHNALPFVQMRYFGNSGPIGSATRQTFAGITNAQRVSVQGTAPTGTTFIEVQVGIALTPGHFGDQAGAITVQDPQLEPVWFPYLQAYPTPDCNASQIGCYVMPNGVTIRQTRLGAGMVVDLEPTYESETSRVWHIGYQGATHLLDKRFVNGTFTNQYDDEIIISQVALLYPNQLTTNGVIRGALIDSRSYDDISLSEVCQDMANTSGGTFYVTAYYDTVYQPVGSNMAPYGLSDNPDNVTTFAYHDWAPTKDLTQLRNIVTVHGAPFTGSASDSFTADGSTKKFFLSETKPKTILSVKRNGTEQTKGILGNALTTFSNTQCLADFLGGNVQFQNNLTVGDTLVVQYIFDSQIRAQEKDLGSYQQYQLWVDSKVNDPNITTTQAAQQRAIEELNQFAYAMLTPKFKTYVALKPGQAVQITSVPDGLNAAGYLVQTVGTTLKGGGVIEYDVVCGADIPTFTRLQKRLKKSTARSGHLAGSVLSSEGVVLRDAFAMGLDSITASSAGLNATDVYGNAAARWGYSSWG